MKWFCVNCKENSKDSDKAFTLSNNRLVCEKCYDEGAMHRGSGNIGQTKKRHINRILDIADIKWLSSMWNMTRRDLVELRKGLDKAVGNDTSDKDDP